MLERLLLEYLLEGIGGWGDDLRGMEELELKMLQDVVQKVDGFVCAEYPGKALIEFESGMYWKRVLPEEVGSVTPLIQLRLCFLQRQL